MATNSSLAACSLWNSNFCAPPQSGRRYLLRGYALPFRRGKGIVSVELARLQYWAEETSDTLDGQNGQIGMIQEWQDFKTERRTLQTLLKLLLGFVVFVCGVPAVLVSLSALGIIHLR